MRINEGVNVFTAGEVQQICATAFRILEEIGVLVENEALAAVLREFGATVDAASQRVKFSRRLVENFLAAASADYDQLEGLQVSCLLPDGQRAVRSRGVECTAGSYPQMYLDLDGTLNPHTLESAANMTRLGDYLENIDRLGVMGVPSDIPGALGPLYMRLIAWKNATRKPSGSGEVNDPALFPYLLEMCKLMADHKKAPLRRYAYAEVELISPLKFTRQEAEIFARFWKHDLLCGIGCMHSAGGSAPVTLAGTLALMVAENIFINVLYARCYGLKKLWFQANASVLDMKHAMMPFGRPERGLLALAMGQLARHFRGGLWASAVSPDAKLPSCEVGMQYAFNVIPSLMAGSLGLECFGLLSSAEIGSPVQLVLDNEFAGAIKRFARGFEVNEETLAFQVISEEFESGLFTASEHTVAHYRTEHWQPTFFTRSSLNSWLAGKRKIDTDFAREIAQEVFRSHHPVNISEEVERELLKIIGKAGQALL